MFFLPPALIACTDSDDLILATTTSLQDSGLLDALVPAFEEAYGYRVKTIAVGSGQALRLGEEGEADVILAHSPEAEESFVAAGHGIERSLVMQNDFVIVGPAHDPARVRESGSAVAAFRRIAGSGSLFVSRGDRSGTHAQELALWEVAGVMPSGPAYQETGQGMGATLLIAGDKRAYTLSDRATYLVQRDNTGLELLLQGDPELTNPYHVIVVNPDRHPNVNYRAAHAFAQFLLSAAAQQLIAEFGVERYGEPLFYPRDHAEVVP